jgi:DNA processing protein
VSPDVVQLYPLDPTYPVRLRGLPCPPATLWVRGGSLEAEHAVAIVGSREAVPEALQFAESLATELARAGVVVVSGGALGIDAAAHRGALAARGRTWVVAGTGCEHCYPRTHQDLFDRVGCGPGAVLWPFAPEVVARQHRFLARNEVLVALSDAVVVVQAGSRSGALNAASNACRQRKPLWVVPAAPWTGTAFEGSRQLLARHGQPLFGVSELLATLFGRRPRGRGAPALPALAAAPPPAPTPPLPARPPPALTEEESRVHAALQTAPLHLDEIASRAHSPVPAVTAALLTLALEDVVVEGPPSFFRLKTEP